MKILLKPWTLKPASARTRDIGAIYGLEEIDRQRLLVLELVDGETLAARISRGPLPLDEALSIGRQIAEALPRLHRKRTRLNRLFASCRRSDAPCAPTLHGPVRGTTHIAPSRGPRRWR